jgi:hypothetical protein
MCKATFRPSQSLTRRRFGQGYAGKDMPEADDALPNPHVVIAEGSGQNNTLDVHTCPATEEQ